MEKEKILKIGRDLKGGTSVPNFYGRAAELKNLIQASFGKNNSFYEAVDKVKITAPQASYYLDNIIDSFLRAVENDLISSISIERKIKIGVVREYLSQAEDLLESGEFHPAAAAVVAGASLEEFLRNWVNEEDISNEEIKPTIDGYAKFLRKGELITKQDYKEITVWAGYRNDAAHGNWAAVEDSDKIALMVRGVSVFIKQYSK